MSVRKMSVKLGAAAVAVSGLTFAALAPAGAATTEDPFYLQSNSGFADGTDLAANSIIGAGSDTIQFVDGALAQAYNKANPTAAPFASLSACYEPGTKDLSGATVAGSTIQFSCEYPTGAAYPFTVGGKSILTTSGAGTSGDGANLLDNGGVTNTAIAFARTSGPKEVGKLGIYPFALDQVVAVVSNNVKSNAPATITRAELYGIYAGIYTNWDQLGGKNAPIHAYYPNNVNSGTLAAFYGALDLETSQGSAAGINVITPSAGTPAAKSHFVSNVAVNDSSLVASGEAGKPIVEHDPAAIENDPDAVAPFSYSRIIMDEKTAGDPSTAPIKALKGWVLDRAVFNELRDYNLTDKSALQGVPSDWVANDPQADSDSIVNTLFGPDGYLCGADAAKIMEQWGFYQLNKGTCGVELTSGSGNPPSLGAVGAPSVSTTTATVSGSKVNVTVASGDTSNTATPSGKVAVTFVGFDTVAGAKKAAPAVTATLSGGKATVNVPAKVLAGQYQAAVAYEGNSSFQASWSDAENGSVTPQTVTVKAGKLTATTKKAGKNEVVSVSYPHAAGKATVSVGKKVLGHASITASGTVKFAASKVKKGQKLTVKVGGKTVKVAAK